MSLFTKDTAKVWGIILQDTHLFLHGIESFAKTAEKEGPAILELMKMLPTGTAALPYLQAAFTLLGKAAQVAVTTEAVAATGGLSITLDLQELKDIRDLIKAGAPIFAMLGHIQPNEVTSTVVTK